MPRRGYLAGGHFKRMEILVSKNSVSLTPPLAFLYKIGECRKCMRQSFQFAAAMVVALGIGAIFASALGPIIWVLAGVTAAAVALYLTHLVVFAIRVTFFLRNSVPVSATPEEVAEAEKPLTRRKALTGLAKAFAGAAVATAIPTAAFAWGECPGRLNCGYSSCNGGDIWCCPKGYPELNLCNCRCYRNVNDVMNAGCNSTGSCFDQDF